MNAANADRSERLQRVLYALKNWGTLSTRDIMRVANVCAVSACISELRANGYNIPPSERLNGNYYYRLEA